MSSLLLGQYPNSFLKHSTHNKDTSELSGGKQEALKGKSPESP